MVLHMHGIIESPHTPGVLMLPSDDGLRLPHVQYDYFHVNESTFCQDVAKLLNSDKTTFTLLYRTYREYNKIESQRIGCTVNVLEQHGPLEIPEGAVWVTKESLRHCKVSQTFAPTWMVVETFLCHESKELLKYRPMWARKGWFSKASLWMQEQFQKKGYEQKGNIICNRNKYSTCVMFVETNKGRVFFKATEGAILEATFTGWISDVLPNVAPVVLSTNADLNALLMEDFTSSHYEAHPRTKEEGMKLLMFLGKMQVKLAEHLENPATRNSCPVKKMLTPRKLAMRLESILDDTEVQSILSPEDLAEFRRQSKASLEMCDRLENTGVPCSFVHGDLYGGNCAASNSKPGDYFLFDWYYGSV